MLDIEVTADQVRWLARKRVSLALGALPLFLLLGCGALVVSLNLALVAVLSGFFAYACLSIAGRQRAVAREATSFEITVKSNQRGSTSRPKAAGKGSSSWRAASRWVFLGSPRGACCWG